MEQTTKGICEYEVIIKYLQNIKSGYRTKNNTC
jgi:hypothetical protein